MLPEADVRAQVASDDARSRDAKSLQVELDAALANVERGNRIAAINQLNAFIDEVRGLMPSVRLDTAGGQALINSALEIVGSVEQLEGL